jgi:tartrate dehydrogenase/decarboxylase/D-malate dehydrogenase
LLLQHLGRGESRYEAAAAEIVGAIESVLAAGPRTRDMGGTATTEELGAAIAHTVANPASIEE